jgi:inner membrane protein YidH
MPEPDEYVGGDKHRTHLAAERTYLAWWRSGLAALAVAIAVGRILPDLSKGSRWPYVLLGLGYAALGFLFLGYGVMRERHVHRSLTEARWIPVSTRFLVALAILAALLVLGTVALILAAI